MECSPESPPRLGSEDHEGPLVRTALLYTDVDNSHTQVRIPLTETSNLLTTALQQFPSPFLCDFL